MSILKDLRERGLVAQTVFEEDLDKLLEKPVVFYSGYDPTHESLHLGHLVSLLMLARMQKAGHKPIMLMGGGTAMIGDPSFRTDMRPMLTREQIDHNVESIKKQVSNIVNFEGSNAAVIVNNADWLLKLNYIDFIREVGSSLSVNKMLTADCFKSRLEKGLSFLEFNYMPMQAYDFLHLYQNYNCQLEVGGNDQWSNILAGEDLIRRKLGKPAFAFTTPLLLTSSGTKMGKTAGGAIFLSAKFTSPLEMFQYLRNVDDADVETCLKMLTFVPVSEIKTLTANFDERMNTAKERLAYEVVKIVHGEKIASETLAQVKAAFSGDADSMQETLLEILPGEKIVNILVKCKACISTSDARRMIEQKSVKINEELIENVNEAISEKIYKEKTFVLTKGKKFKAKIKIK